MGTKKKEPESWSDKLGADAEVPAEPTFSQPLPPPPGEDPLLHDPIIVIAKLKRDHEIETKVLRRELHLAKARILELELQALGVRTES